MTPRRQNSVVLPLGLDPITHPIIAHHVFGDCSARSIANDIAPSVYKALITRNSATSEGKNDNADIGGFFRDF